MSDATTIWRRSFAEASVDELMKDDAAMTADNATGSTPGSNDAELSEVLERYLEEAGARVERDEEFQERYNLDFSVTRLDEVYAHVNLGVHVTTSLDDHERIETFAQVARRGIVLKALYIEVGSETVDSGALLVAFGACLSFLFDRRYQQVKAMGMRIYEDCSFNFFELDEALDRLGRVTEDDDLDIGASMDGRIIAYFTDKGYGFIQTEDERKFFFHIANIVDDELRQRLPGYVPGEVIPVEFQYGGHDGKKYPKAINVSFPGE